MGELAGAGLSQQLSAKWGLKIDQRRRSVIDANVSALKVWRGHPSAARRVETRMKEVEEEIEKAGREVKKEAVKAEKGAVKVEHAVKEDVKKVEKAAKRKAKPKKKAGA